MQLDFERGRRVELAEITGAVVRLGRRQGVPTPTYDVVYAILRVRAATFGNDGSDAGRDSGSGLDGGSGSDPGGGSGGGFRERTGR